MDEEEIKKILLCENIGELAYCGLIDKLDDSNNNDLNELKKQAAKELLNLYKREKKKNKKLDLENQALYESINLNDDTTLAKEYKKIKEENEILSLNGVNIKILMEMREKFVSKDRIRAKKEEWNKSIRWANADDYYYAMKMLDELLEEE